MNELGITFFWLAFQITLVIVPAVVLHLLASRRGPVAGAWVAAGTLFTVLMLTLLSRFPQPDSNAVFKTETAQTAPAPGISASAGPLSTAPGSSAYGLTFDQVRSIWRQAGLPLPSASSPSARWADVVAMLVLVGTAFGLLRLLVGIWAVRRCRRSSRTVDEPELLETLETLKANMACHRGVELRELRDLDTPATAGWLRPLIFLPADWRSWPRSDLQAVLAHELAHILRSDYVVGLAARVVLALHFYHPLVRWLAGRLFAQQELAADAVGARFAGGRGAYLAVLSRMALRQDRRISTWPARAFSPARGTLIRRIRMLKVHGAVADRTWTMPARVLAVALLASLTLGVWLLPRPLRGADGEKVAMAEAKPERPAASDVPAFDLSYVPDDAMGVFAIHPAAIFMRNGMNTYANQLDALRSTPKSAAKNSVTMVRLSEASGKLEFQAQSTQPWDWRTLPVEQGFTENWIVRSFIESNEKAVALDFDNAAGRHEPLVRLLRLDLPISG